MIQEDLGLALILENQGLFAKNLQALYTWQGRELPSSPGGGELSSPCHSWGHSDPEKVSEGPSVTQGARDRRNGDQARVSKLRCQRSGSRICFRPLSPWHPHLNR
ncbi:unnamed protein product [Lepidochelys olivacea]